jgi:hypothetical protein
MREGHFSQFEELFRLIEPIFVFHKLLPTTTASKLSNSVVQRQFCLNQCSLNSRKMMEIGPTVREGNVENRQSGNGASLAAPSG